MAMRFNLDVILQKKSSNFTIENKCVPIVLLGKRLVLPVYSYSGFQIRLSRNMYD